MKSIMNFLWSAKGAVGSSLEVVLIAVVVAIAVTTLVTEVVTGTSTGETLAQVLVPLIAWIGAVVVSVRQFMMK